MAPNFTGGPRSLSTQRKTSFSPTRNDDAGTIQKRRWPLDVRSPSSRNWPLTDRSGRHVGADGAHIFSMIFFVVLTLSYQRPTSSNQGEYFCSRSPTCLTSEGMFVAMTDSSSGKE